MGDFSDPSQCQPSAFSKLSQHLHQKDTSLFKPAPRDGVLVSSGAQRFELQTRDASDQLSRLESSFQQQILQDDGHFDQIFVSHRQVQPNQRADWQSEFFSASPRLQTSVETNKSPGSEWANQFHRPMQSWTPDLVHRGDAHSDTHHLWTKEFEKYENLTVPSELVSMPPEAHNDGMEQAWKMAELSASLWDHSSILAQQHSDLPFQDMEHVWNDKTTESLSQSISQSLSTALNQDEYDLLDDAFNRASDVMGNENLFDLEYVFEQDNPFVNVPNPFVLGKQMREGGGNLTDAALAFEAAIQGDEATELAWLNLAECQAENEKESAAIAAFRQCLKINPTHPRALIGLAVSYTNEGMELQILDLLSRWISAQYHAYWMKFGLDSLELPDLSLSAKRDKLSEVFLNIIRAFASSSSSTIDPDLQIGLGILFYNAGQFDKAIDCFAAALQYRPEDYQLWNRLGATLANSNQSEAAISKYEKALSLKPSFVRAMHNLGVSCMNIGCYKEAAEHLLTALATHDPRHKNISHNLWETLKRNFVFMDRMDLANLCDSREVNSFRSEFSF